MAFDYDTNYSVANTGAHRKPAPLVSVPGIIQHFAFWRPHRVPKEEWHRNIDAFLCQLFNVLKGYDSDIHHRRGTPSTISSPNVNHTQDRISLLRHIADLAAGLVPSRQGQVQSLELMDVTKRRNHLDVFSVNLFFFDIALTVRAELRNELWTLSFIADLSKTRASGLSHDVFHLLRSRIDLIETMMLSQSRQKAETFLGKSEQSNTELAETSQALYATFHEFLRREILSRCDPGSASSPIQTCFADFRGAVVGVAVKKPKSAVTGQEEKTEESSDDAEEFESFSTLYAPQGNRRSHSSRLNYDHFSTATSLRLLDRLWPLVTRIFPDRDERSDVFSKPEFTISRFIGRKAIYLTALGRLPETFPWENTDPVRYLLIVNYPSRWQIGRVVDRIHRMGVARLAALYDLAEMQNASRRLRILADDWQSSIRRGEGITDPIDFSKKLDAINASVEHGLLNRIERSEYYVAEWNDLVSQIRSERIEGFQTYPDFVLRRMGSSFAFVRSLGVRYNDLRKDVDGVIRRKSSERASETLEAIRQIEITISKTTDQMRENQSLTNKNLKAAEVFLGVGIFYYIGTAGFEIAEAVFGLLDRQADKNGITLWAFAVTAVAVGLGLFVRSRMD